MTTLALTRLIFFTRVVLAGIILSLPAGLVKQFNFFLPGITWNPVHHPNSVLSIHQHSA